MERTCGPGAFHFESRLNTRVARENAAPRKLRTLEAVTRREKRNATKRTGCPILVHDPEQQSSRADSATLSYIGRNRSSTNRDYKPTKN